MRMGVLGGTFNPIHMGHLILAETARDKLGLDRVLLIPTANPPHKRVEGNLSGKKRLEFVRAAIRGHSALRASALEIKRGGVSYTIDTMRTLCAREPRAHWYLIIGQDLLSVQWHSWSELKNLSTIVAVRRTDAPDVPKERGVRWMTMPKIDITSSDIRKRVRTGRSIRYLVPAVIERKILKSRPFQRNK